MKNFLQKYYPALLHKNYRYYWFSQLVSLIGTWIQRMAQSWLVYTMTGSATKLGIVTALQFLPILMFSLFFGPVIDRYKKKHIIIYTQIVSMFLALLLAVLVFSGLVEYYQIALIAFALGVANALDMPSRQSYMIELVGRKDLLSAVGLNSAIFNLARILGPALSGVLMASINMGWCFLLNAISFLPVIYALYRIKDNSVKPIIDKTHSMIYEVKEGLRYIAANDRILTLMAILLITGIFSFNFQVLIPILSKETFLLKEQGFGALMATMGLGAFLGALSTSIRSKTLDGIYIVGVTSFLLAIILILIGLSDYLFVTVGLLFFSGLSSVWLATTANSTLQIEADTKFRGRVMSVHALVFAGSTPIGNFMSGFLAEKLGPQNCFIINGIAIIILLVVFKIAKGAYR